MQLCRLVDVWSQACRFISLLTRAESLSRCTSHAGDDWFFFYSLFSTHLQCDWLLTPFLIHVWQSETLAHTRLHKFHPVWSRYLHTDSLKEWVRCLSCIANWCFIYHQWDCLHFPPIVLYKRTERTNVLKLVLSCIIKHTNTFYMYLYADDFFSLCLHSTTVSTYIRQWITVCTLIGNHIALFLICMKLNSTHPCFPEISLFICS